MSRVPLALSALGLMLSLIAFVASFLGVSWPVGTFVLMALAAAQFGPVLAKYPRSSDPSTMLQHRESLGRHWHSRPRWLWRLTVTAGGHAVVQVVAFFLLSPSGSASEWNGRYVLHDRSRVIRELSEVEYRQALALNSRLSTAILMAVFIFLVAWNWRSEERDGA